MAQKRWAKTTKELDFEYENDRPHDRDICFEEYDTIVKGYDPDGEEAFIATRLGTPPVFYYHWVTYSSKDDTNFPVDLKRSGKRKYEIYVGGFLDFYDDAMKPFLLEYAEKKKLSQGFQTELQAFLNMLELNNPQAPHSIYFDWGREKGKVKSVSIYMHPKPGNPDPRTPKAPPPPDS